MAHRFVEELLAKHHKKNNIEYYTEPHICSDGDFKKLYELIRQDRLEYQRLLRQVKTSLLATIDEEYYPQNVCTFDDDYLKTINQ